MKQDQVCGSRRGHRRRRTDTRLTLNDPIAMCWGRPLPQNLGQAFLALVKSAGAKMMTPFTVALMLSLGRVQRYEDKVRAHPPSSAPFVAPAIARPARRTRHCPPRSLYPPSPAPHGTTATNADAAVRWHTHT